MHPSQPVQEKPLQQPIQQGSRLNKIVTLAKKILFNYIFLIPLLTFVLKKASLIKVKTFLLLNIMGVFFAYVFKRVFCKKALNNKTLENKILEKVQSKVKGEAGQKMVTQLITYFVDLDKINEQKTLEKCDNILKDVDQFLIDQQALLRSGRQYMKLSSFTDELIRRKQAGHFLQEYRLDTISRLANVTGLRETPGVGWTEPEEFVVKHTEVLIAILEKDDYNELSFSKHAVEILEGPLKDQRIDLNELAELLSFLKNSSKSREQIDAALNSLKEKGQIPNFTAENKDPYRTIMGQLCASINQEMLQQY